MNRGLLVSVAIWLAGCHSGPGLRPEADLIPLQVTRKVALVIGNTNYRELPLVAAASADAYDMDDTLRALRFDQVELKTNVTAPEMAHALETFARSLRQDDLAILYFSGHGGQAGGRSYLLPIDYRPPPGAAQVEARGGYPISRVRDLLDATPARVRVIVFDACRGALITESPSADVGLRAMHGQPGTLIAYSAPPAGIAPFDQGRHSFYTAELLSILRSPDRDLKAMLDDAQLRVYRLTNRRQVPYLHGTLEQPLFLGSLSLQKIAAGERSAWAAAGKAETPAGYQTYLRQFPNGAFADLARMKLAAQQQTPGLAPGDTQLNPKDGQQYAWIPPGTFMLDCADEVDLCRPEEKPSVRVTIGHGFRLGLTEVTVGAWKRYRQATNAAALPTKDPDGRVDLNEASADDLMPAVGMTRDAAHSFCGWIGGRLPKEEEWEYAARSVPIADGPGWEDTVWYAGNSGRRWLNSSEVKALTPSIYDAQLYGNGDGPHPVAQKEPNAWRLYDMLGNVWEWVEPRVSGAKLGLLRGGSWASTEADIGVSRRMWVNPDVQLHDIGLRCAWDVP